MFKISSIYVFLLKGYLGKIIKKIINYFILKSIKNQSFKTYFVQVVAQPFKNIIKKCFIFEQQIRGF